MLLLNEPRTFNEAKQRLRTHRKSSRQSRKGGGTNLESGEASRSTGVETRLHVKIEPKKKALFLYLRGPQTAFVLGEESAPGAMIEIVGAENAAGKIKAALSR